MGRITIRVPDPLLDRIDEDRDEEEGRSQWFREAARAELDRDDRDELRSEIEGLKERLDEVESHFDQPLWKRLLSRPFPNEDTNVRIVKEDLSDEEIEEYEKRAE